MTIRKYKTGFCYLFLILTLLSLTTVRAVETPPPPPLAEYNLNLAFGWNLVSFPVIPVNPSVTNIFSDVEFYQIVEWTGSGYVKVSEVDGHKGYWVLVFEETTINLRGDAVLIEPYNLDIGWNMIGTTMSPSEPLPLDVYQMVTWTGTGYIPASVLEPGKGYWALKLP